MKSYVLKRILQLIVVLFVITFLSYGMMRLAGSDAVLQKMENTGTVVSQELIARAQAELGLDQPFLTQYFTWLRNLLHGDMGNSYVSGEAIFPAFLEKLPATLLLTLASLLLTVVISVPLGILTAVRQNRFCDYLIRFCSFVGSSLPGFFIALLLMYVFAIRLDLFPVISTEISFAGLVLPTLTLAIAMSAKYLRQVRSAVLEELGQDYVTGAMARGVPFHMILTNSVMKSCLVTILTLLMLSLGSLLGGTAIIETIFMWDGVGKMAVDAIEMRDYPMIQAYVMWMAIIYVCVNLVTDLLYRVLDPRIRPEEERTDAFRVRRRNRAAGKNKPDPVTGDALRVRHRNRAAEASGLNTTDHAAGASKSAAAGASGYDTTDHAAAASKSAAADYPVVSSKPAANDCTAGSSKPAATDHTVTAVTQTRAVQNDIPASVTERTQSDTNKTTVSAAKQIVPDGNDILASAGIQAQKVRYKPPGSVTEHTTPYRNEIPASAAVRTQKIKKDRSQLRHRVFAVLVIALMLVVVFAGQVCPYDPYAQTFESLQAPTLSHPLGTDIYGRDLLSRVIMGLRTSVLSALAAVGLITVIGTCAGIAAGWFGGVLDTIIMRICDVCLAFPGLVFAMAIAALTGGGMVNAVLALAATSWPKFARLARSRTLSLKHADFINAARLSGSTPLQIVARHILLNIAGTILITAALDIGTMMMELAALSFLGLGAQPPVAELGNMMSTGRSMLQTSPWVVLGPGIAIFVAVTIFNLLGDTLRDRFDPKGR